MTNPKAADRSKYVKILHHDGPNCVRPKDMPMQILNRLMLFGRQQAARFGCDPAVGAGGANEGPRCGPSGGQTKAAVSNPTQAQIQAIRDLQNNPRYGPNLGGRVNPRKQRTVMPEYLHPDALHTLGFVRSRGRSRVIMKKLLDAGVVGEGGGLLRRDANLGQLVAKVQQAGPRWRKTLTPNEVWGVKVYLEGVYQNLDCLGQDISKLPQQNRYQWFCYAGFDDFGGDSQWRAQQLIAAGVLAPDCTPRDGGAAFDTWMTYEMIWVAATAATDEDIESVRLVYESLRDTLFPLPRYKT